MTRLSFEQIAIVPVSGLSTGRIYFETSTGLIKVAKNSTTTEIYGDGVKSASWNSDTKALQLVNESGEVINVNLSDVASASAVTTAINAVKATAAAAAPKTTVYTKTETDTQISTAIGKVYKVKGSLANAAALIALTGVTIGDTYNITAAGTLNGEPFEAGSNFVATIAGLGNQAGMWDKLGGTVDLTAYATTAELNTAIQGLDKADAAVAGQVVSSVSEANGIITVARRKLTESDIPALSTTKVTGLDSALSLKVPTTRTVNALPLSGNIVLSGGDILVGGAAPYGAGTIQTALKDVDTRIVAAAASGVQSFGGETGAITLKAPVATNGSVTLAMANNELQASVVGLGTAAYTASTAYASAAQGALAATALQSANIASGAAKGTIAVKGVDVAIKGLGTAAYTASSAYDSAGSSTTALANAKSYADGLMVWADFA